MMPRRLHPFILVVLVAMIAIVLTTAFFSQEIRGALVFKPVRLQVELAAHRVADAEAALYRKSGRLLPLSATDTSPSSQILGIDWRNMTAEKFQFEAKVLGNQHLQLRALPKPEAIADLEVPSQMYIADLSPKGDFLSGGWYP